MRNPLKAVVAALGLAGALALAGCGPRAEEAGAPPTPAGGSAAPRAGSPGQPAAGGNFAPPSRMKSSE